MKPEKPTKAFVTSWFIHWVSLVAFVAAKPTKNYLRKIPFSNVLRHSGKNVNNKINNENLVLFALSFRALSSNKPSRKHYRSITTNDTAIGKFESPLTYQNVKNLPKVSPIENLISVDILDLDVVSSLDSHVYPSHPSHLSLNFPSFFYLSSSISVNSLNHRQNNLLESKHTDLRSIFIQQSEKPKSNSLDSNNLRSTPRQLQLSNISYPSQPSQSVTSKPTKLTRKPSKLKNQLLNQPSKNKPSRETYKNLRRTLLINRSVSFLGEHQDDQHWQAIVRMKLKRSQDVESNPGPPSRENPGTAELQVISYNVRGLNDELKLRHLINFCYGLNKNGAMDTVICLQETYIEKPGKIPYLWRGNFHLTAGRGNRLGCITLLNHQLSILHATNLGDRGHLLVCQKTGQQQASFIICNLYAPNINNQEKISFFDDIINELMELETRFNCNKVIMAGDYNLIFKPNEGKNRANSAQERNVARTVGNQLKELNLVDIWEKGNQFTWNRPNSDSFSTIDHVFFSKEHFNLKKTKTNWAVSLSDHAMIIASLEIKGSLAPFKTNITRLDPSVLDEENKDRITAEISSMIGQAPGYWTPHQKLEFAKVSIRTILEKEQALRKVREASEEELLNTELDMAIKTLERGALNGAGRIEILNLIEELRVRKEILIENKGKRLAERLGTKWYNEGEKSTKYFLRLLNRASPTNFEELINEQGEKLTDTELIETEVVNFYKNLYESYPQPQSVDDLTFFDEITGVSRETDELVAQPITTEELGQILDTCQDSAPGPDGIPYSVLKNLWSIFGPILTAAWNYSIATGNLPPSHKLSYLRLIPKAGKDKSKLTNWRPITLSNCDHKIISKLYAKRIAEKVSELILERQTAYLKGRLINDNIRTLLGALKTSNIEENINGIIVSLDAKKAFDSVEHSYIIKTLRHFGLNKFVPIFETLYADLQSNILINGKIVKGYRINRGVKQGDALSCILFIMCMEPLLRNIEANNLIQEIRTLSVGTLPKALSYADDVNCIVSNDPITLQEIFKEYERLTKLAGLELNAAKTEILPFVSENLNLDKSTMRFNFQYNHNHYNLPAMTEMKVNGIWIQQDENLMKDTNVGHVLKKMENHLKTWSARNLSVLGKILIVKTFGISQIIFLMQSIVLNENHFVKLNSLLYKFIWNRHFMAAKAPERIKREIVNKPIKLGGLGMLNIRELDSSLKLKALGRLFGTMHPYLNTLKNKIVLTDFFNPFIQTSVDEIASMGIALLKSNRSNHLASTELSSNSLFIKALKSIKITRLLRNNGNLSLAWHNLHTRGARSIGDLTLRELGSLERFIDRSLLNNLRLATTTPNNLHQGTCIETSLIVGTTFKNLTTLSSKEIRLNLGDNTPITIFKIGPIMSPSQSINWASCLNKLTNTKHKDILLRLIHGELYSKERLYRYRLVDSSTCLRCGNIETLKHKYFDCPYIREIWSKTLKLTDKLRLSIDPTETLIEKALCCTHEPNKVSLILHAEIISRIRQLRDNDANLLLLPKLFVKKAAEWTLRREQSTFNKNTIVALLENY